MATGGESRIPFRDAAEILILGLVLLAPQLLLRDIWGPDETRFAEVAREMVARGDYLVPHLNGEIYAEKPPLCFWLAAALRGVFGADAGRVVSVASALAALLLPYGMGRRLYGREEGLWAARIAATTMLFLGLGRTGILDSLLLATILAAIACGHAALEGQSPRARAWWLGAYAAAAAAILTKGPIGLAIPALVLLAHGLARRRRVRAGGWWHFGGALLMLALVAAWLVPACLRGGELYARKIILQQTLERVGSSAIHGEPPHYYLTRWPLFLWPWSLLLPLSLVAALRAARRSRDWRPALPALWFLAVFAFLSLISGKGERYFLPAVPAAALACAHYLCSARSGGVPWPRWHRGLLGATWLSVLAIGGFLVVVGLAPDAVLRASPNKSEAAAMFREVFTPAHAAGVVAFGGALIAASLLALSWVWRAVGARRHGGMLVGIVVAVALGFDLVALPTINQSKSDRRAVAHFRPYLDQAEELCLFRTEFDGIFNLYLGKARIPLLDTAEQAIQRLAAPRRVAVAVWKSQVELLDPAERCQVVPAGPGSPRNLVLLVNWRPDPPPGAEERR